MSHQKCKTVQNKPKVDMFYIRSGNGKYFKYRAEEMTFLDITPSIKWVADKWNATKCTDKAADANIKYFADTIAGKGPFTKVKAV